MTGRRHLSQLGLLQRLQHAERAVAGGLLAVARAREYDAGEAARHDADQAQAITGYWHAAHADGCFNPEWRAALGAQLIAAETQANASAQAERAAAAARSAREDGWRLADARIRATDRVIGTARRALDRRVEETRLDAVLVRAAARRNGR